MKQKEMIDCLEILSGLRALPADRYREAAAQAIDQLRWRSVEDEPYVHGGCAEEQIEVYNSTVGTVEIWVIEIWEKDVDFDRHETHWRPLYTFDGDFCVNALPQPPEA